MHLFNMYVLDTMQGSTDKNGVYIFKGEQEYGRKKGGKEREAVTIVLIVVMVVTETIPGLQNLKL